MNSSTHKVAVITGASSGIGRATALQLAELGYAVALAARTESKLREVAAEIGDGRALVHPCDVGKPAEVEKLIQAVYEHFGRIDVLVNNAGLVFTKTLTETSVKDWQATLDVNLTSAFVATRAVWPIFTKQHSGIVVNISSVAAKTPHRGFVAYATAKVGLNMLTQMTGEQAEAIGARAVCIAPGAVETPMLRSVISKAELPPDKAMPPEVIAQLICDCVTGKRLFSPGETIYISR